MSDFDFEYSWEMCPNCEKEQPLVNGFVVHTCVECGEPLFPCSLCDMESVNCSEECPFKNIEKHDEETSIIP